MPDIKPLPISELRQLHTLIADLHQVLGTSDQFWDASCKPELVFESPEQIKDLTSDLLIKLFGLEVRGL